MAHQPTTPKTFTRNHANIPTPPTSEDYEAYLVLTETSTRHRYALRLRRPIRALRYLTHRSLHLAA
jgi:hypothetical protein